MPKLSRDVWLGAGVILFGVVLLTILIPFGVTSPSTVRNPVLAPTFWPNIVASLLILIGASLMARRLVAVPEAPELETAEDTGWRPGIRIGAAGALMAAFYFSLPVLGMPLTSAIAFLCFTALVRVGRPIVTLLTAILLPLMLHGFFSHVAGVPIPQGQLMRLP